MTRLSFACLSFVLLAVCACDDPYQRTMRPDYTIRVVATPKGDVALPPTCPSWATDNRDPFDNQPDPEFGCATARNLALSVERPDDLVRGRELGPQRGATAVGSIRRYDNDQTRGLIDPNTNSDSAIAATTATTAASSLTGDVTGGPGATAAPPAAASSGQ